MSEPPEITPQLVESVKRRDPDAVVGVYRALSGPVFGYLLRRMGDRSAAEDVTAEVFCEVIESAGRFEGTPAGFRAWVFRIARNTMYDHFRRESYRRHPSIEEATEAGSIPTSDADTEGDAIGAVEREHILERVGELTTDQRDVILLRLVADLSIAEVANMLGKTEGAVKALQHRAVRALADELDESDRAP